MKMKYKILTILILIPFLLVLAFEIYLSQNDCGFFISTEKDLINGTDPSRYEYWTCYASAGWADAEQKEFKLLNDKYGIPGNPQTHGFNNGEIAIWVKKIIPEFPQYEIWISIYKDISTKNIRIEAQLAWSDKEVVPYGIPEIKMNIPLSEFNNIMQSWLSHANINKLVNEAKKQNWKTVDWGKPYMPEPDIFVEYMH